MSDETREGTPGPAEPLVSAAPARMPVVLPSGDVYLGPQLGGRPDNISPLPAVVGDPVKDPIKQALEDARHSDAQPTVKCVWCGQWLRGEAEFMNHVRALHGKELGENAEDERAKELAMDRRRQSKEAAVAKVGPEDPDQGADRGP